MKFTNLLKNIILEAQSKYLINLEKVTKPLTNKEGKKLKPLMTKEVYNELVKADPGTNLNDIDLDTQDKNELEKVKAGSYVPWLIKQYLSIPTEAEKGTPMYERELKQAQATFLEDLYKVTNDLKKFERFKNRIPQESRDVNKLTVQSLYELVKDFSLEKTKASKEEKKAASETYEHPGGEIAYRGDKWTVAKIEDKGKLGKDAACFYGGNYLEPSKGETRWCTSSPGLDWFNRYIKDGPLYVVIPNQWEGKRGESSGLPATRYQFHFPSNQFMDVADHGVDLVKLLNGEMSELKDFFKPEFARGLTLDGTSLKIDSFSHGAIGKFVGLYGIHDLFENLPTSLETLTIKNNEKNDIIIHIPDDIDRFSNLNFLHFENCIDSLPETVCNLKKLRFLTVQNNPKLRTVPGCIVNLPELVFLNAKECPNLDVPQEIRDKGADFGNGMWDFTEDED